jgi:hypothetical protein
MIVDARIWRAAMARYFLVLAASVITLTTSDQPLEGTPTPRIITDKNIYRWGETIHVECALSCLDGMLEARALFRIGMLFGLFALARYYPAHA